MISHHCMRLVFCGQYIGYKKLVSSKGISRNARANLTHQKRKGYVMKSMISSKTNERTLSVHNEHEILLRLEKAGLTNELSNKVISSKDNELALKLIRLIENGGFEPSTSQKLAREIMGQKMFGVEEAIKFFGVSPSKQQLAYLAEVPWTEEVLRSVKDTHLLVAVFQMSILDIRGHVEGKGLFYSQDWYNKQSFAKDRGEVGWQLVRKEPVKDSTSKTWEEQQALLSKDEETPKAQVMVYSVIGHYLATGEKLFPSIYVRCSDLDSDGDRVYVGRFDSDGLRVDGYWDDCRDDDIGLSSARKLQ